MSQTISSPLLDTLRALILTSLALSPTQKRMWLAFAAHTTDDKREQMRALLLRERAFLSGTLESPTNAEVEGMKVWHRELREGRATLQHHRRQTQEAQATSADEAAEAELLREIEAQ